MSDNPTIAKSDSSNSSPRGLLVALILALLLAAIWWKDPPIWWRDLMVIGPVAGMVSGLLRRSLAPGQPVKRSLSAFAAAAAIFGVPAGLEALNFAHLVDWMPALFAACAIAGVLGLFWQKRPEIVRLKEAQKKREDEARLGRKPSPPELRPAMAGLALLCLAGYGFALFTAVDERLDWLPSQLIRTQVIAKGEAYKRGGTVNAIALDAWGPMPRGYQLSVSPDAYDRLEIGRVACVHLHTGLLKARWFEVEVCPASTAASATVVPLR